MERQSHQDDNDDKHIIDIVKDNDSSSLGSSSDGESYHSTRSSLSLDRERNNPLISSPFPNEKSSSSCGCDRVLNMMDLVVTLVQIVAALVVFTLAEDEHPQGILLAWLIVYTCACITTSIFLSFRFRYHNHYSKTRNEIEKVMNALKIGIIGSFFVMWSVLGIIWISHGHLSPCDAPKLYRLCEVFIVYSCVRFGGAVVLFVGIRILQISVLIHYMGLGCGDIVATLSHLLRAYVEEVLDEFRSYVVALLDVFRSNNVGGRCLIPIPNHDYSCFICLRKYGEGKTRRLECSHVFHPECIETWLRTKLTCPLCQSDNKKMLRC